MNIVLTGMMATGKSSVAESLSEKLSMDYIDTDTLIEERRGIPIKEIFASEGEAAFRKIEKEVIEEVSRRNNSVISTGGGVVKDQKNMELLEENSIVICLTAEIDEIIKRTSGREDRPLINVSDRKAELKRLLSEREDFYARCDASVDTTQRVADEVADEIIRIIERFKKDAD